MFTEPLEARRLLASVSLSLISETLFIRGNATAANTVTVLPSGDGIHLDVAVTTTDPGNVPVVITRQFKIADVRLIKVRGSNQADGVQIGADGSELAINARVDSYGGNDTVVTSDGRDMVSGGVGNDVVRTGGGTDFVYGGRGNDSINGGDDADVLWGGRGNDSLVGGNGDDVLGGILGEDNVLDGGAGKDNFFVKRGATAQVVDFTTGEDRYRYFKNASVDGEDNAKVT